MRLLVSFWQRCGNAARLLLLAVGLTVFPSAVAADALDGQLEVRSAFVNLSDSVYQLQSQVSYPFNDDMRAALTAGVSLSFDLEVVVSRERRWWLDSQLVDLTLRRQLEYHSISDRYLVRDVRTADQQSFATAEEALAELGNIDAWPIATAPQLVPGARYRVAVRASVRRGRLSDAMRVMMFWTNDWQRASEWYEWSLPR